MNAAIDSSGFWFLFCTWPMGVAIGRVEKGKW